jgi:hypothetical protein
VKYLLLIVFFLGCESREDLNQRRVKEKVIREESAITSIKAVCGDELYDKSLKH